MRSSAIALLAVVTAFGTSPTQFRLALPGYHFQFPHDYFNHPDFQTEWWYYTGNLHTAEGRKFGFELTFFRQGIDRNPAQQGVWDVHDVWFAHLALSDIDGKRFLHTERWNRQGAGLAGADETQRRVWNGNWQVQWTGPGEHLQAVAEQFRLDLNLLPAKPPAIHGQNGVSQKSAGAGHASHYFSETRLKTDGTIEIGGASYRVDGLAWMDHEFFTNQLSADETGWDWFSLQFDDGSDLMLYRLRRKDGSADPYSSGTYVDAQGRTLHLSISNYNLSPAKNWKSPATGASYPVAWKIESPLLGLSLDLYTRLPQQELTSSSKAAPSYWEGAIEVTGTKQGKPVKGAGYLEMTGYAGAVKFSE